MFKWAGSSAPQKGDGNPSDSNSKRISGESPACGHDGVRVCRAPAHPATAASSRQPLPVELNLEFPWVSPAPVLFQALEMLWRSVRTRGC